MERSMVWCTLALGGFGLLVGLLASKAKEVIGKPFDLINKSNRWMAFSLPFVVFLFTMPSKAPFAEGHGFGNGFLFGGIAALVSSYLVLRSRTNLRTEVNGSVILTPMWAGIAALSLVEMGNRHILIDAFAGVAIGMLSVMLFIHQGLPNTETDEESPVSTTITSSMVTGIGFTASVAAAMALGEFHGDTAESAVRFSSAALMLGALVPFSAFIATIPGALLARPFMGIKGANKVAGAANSMAQTVPIQLKLERTAQVVIGSTIVLAGGWLLQRHIEMENFCKTVAIGLVASLMVWWLNAESGRTSDGSTSLTMHYRPLAILVMLGASMVSFVWLHNYGVCIALLPIWFTVAIATARKASGAGASVTGISAGDIVAPALFATIIGLLRFIQIRYANDLKGASIADQYTILGLLLGVAAPWILAGIANAPTHKGNVAANSTLKLFAAGLAILAIPGCVIILWKSKTIIALMGGLALSLSGFSPIAAPLLKDKVRQSAALFAIGVALALTQWTHHALLINALTRAQKIQVLEYILLIVGGVLVVSDVYGRISERKAISEKEIAVTGGSK